MSTEEDPREGLEEEEEGPKDRESLYVHDNRKPWAIDLNPGISYLNFWTYWVVNLMIVISMQTKLTFVMFIIKDPNYYNVPDDQVAKVMGDVNSISEIVNII